MASAYKLCILVCMRTTLDLDEDLVRKALAETGAKTKTEVIEMGLRSLLEREARKRLKMLYGSNLRVDEVRRRRG
jgi:Arc/MetJ family transcription regulator